MLSSDPDRRGDSLVFTEIHRQEAAEELLSVIYSETAVRVDQSQNG